ncbi:MAG: hypothetical protein V4598_19065 [Bdellovibrionota bacterium]
MSDETTTEDTKAKVMGKINEIKSNVQTFINDVDVTAIKATLNAKMKEAQKDWNKLVDRDLQDMKKKLQKEKSDVEAKAKKFLDSHKKELNSLQAKIDKLVKSAKQMKAPAKKATKKAITKKVIAKKVATKKKVAKKK